MTFFEALLTFVITMISLFLLIGATIIAGTKEEKIQKDNELKKRAKNGTVILLTCEQYLSLHDAAPEEYPLRPEKLLHRLCSNNSHIRMLHDEYEKLHDIACKALKAENDAAERAVCIEELKKNARTSD